jgi:2-polyprenyl-3-methyl-5-hydroxy-6-metoxy-1,4-benzoquinol methylase
MDNHVFRDYYVDFHKRRNKYGKTLGDKSVELIKQAIGSGKRMLDLGCRDGSLTKNYVEGNEVVSSDVDDIALEICEKRRGIKTVHVDLNGKIPFDDESFDVVVAAEIIEHLIFPENFIEEVKRVLKPDGIFCGSTPNITRFKHRIQFLLGKTPFFNDTSHLRYFSYDSLNEILLEYCNQVNIVPFVGHIIGNKKFGVMGFGIPLTNNTPLLLGKMFSSNLFWKVTKV